VRPSGWQTGVSDVAACGDGCGSSSDGCAGRLHIDVVAAAGIGRIGHADDDCFECHAIDIDQRFRQQQSHQQHQHQCRQPWQPE